MEFSRDIVPILSCLGLFSIFLIWRQLRQTSTWNKLQAQYTFLSSASVEFECNLLRTSKKAGVDLKARKAPLTKEEIERLWQDDEAYMATIAFLNDIETVCTAVEVDMVDHDVAYAANSSRVVKGWAVYEPFISRFRGYYNDEAKELFCHFETIAKLWEKRGQSKITQLEEEISRHERRIETLKCLKKKC